MERVPLGREKKIDDFRQLLVASNFRGHDMQKGPLLVDVKSISASVSIYHQEHGGLPLIM